jgi:hypothetical protein
MERSYRGPVFERVLSDAVRRTSRRQAEGSNLYVERRVFRAGEAVPVSRREVKVERETVMVFADDAPHLNWAHPCRYFLYDAEGGELVREVPGRFPPYMVHAPETFELVHERTHLPDSVRTWKIRPERRIPFLRPRGRRYAVLFSGASNNRHTNDLEFLYRTLVDDYAFSRENIYVLNYDGTINYSGGPHPVTEWPGDDTPYRMPVHGAGTKSQLEGVFNDLKGRLRDEDLLLVHTNNHGGHNGTESYLCTYSGPDYLASDFADKVGELPRFRCLIAMMEQCHSGGFNDPVISRSPSGSTSVSSACEELESSIGGAEFDPFARDWIAAMAGSTPYGGALAYNPDTGGNGRVSAKEAYTYAETVKDPYDSPVFSAAPSTGGSCHLGATPWIFRLFPQQLEAVMRPVFPWPPEERFTREVYQEIRPILEELEVETQRHMDELQDEMRARLAPVIERIVR